MRWALLLRDFSATVLRHTTPDARRQTPSTRDEHLQDSFLALTHSLMPEKVPNRGTEAKPIAGVPIGKLRLSPVPGREKLTPSKQASSGQVETTCTSHSIGKPPYSRMG